MANFRLPRIVRTRTITLAPEERIQHVPRTRHTVRLTPKPYWQEMGWQRDESAFRGQFRAFDRTFPGYIERAYGNTWEYFIYLPEPWPALRDHDKWGCYQLHDKDGWRKVHWIRRPISLDAGIQDIEHVLAQASVR